MEKSSPRRSVLSGKSLLVGILIVLCCASLGALQRHIDSLHDEVVADEIMYFPNDKMLIYFTGGLSNVVADYMWYKTVHYTSAEFNSEEAKFTWLEHMVRSTNNVDPYYADPYIYGGIFLALIGDDDVAVDIFKNGVVHCPKSWRMPYELHSIYLMNKREEPGAQQLASHYAFMVGVRQEGEMKEAYIKLSKDLLSKDNMIDEAVDFFTRAVKMADDPLIRQYAETQLRIAIIEKNVMVLNRAVEDYRKNTGKPIFNLEDLVSVGYLSAVPHNPGDGEYLISKDGKVVSTVLLEPYVEHHLGVLQEKVDTYRAEHERNPVSLDEVWSYYAEDEIEHPIPGEAWHYDAETGVVQ